MAPQWDEHKNDRDDNDTYPSEDFNVPTDIKYSSIENVGESVGWGERRRKKRRAIPNFGCASCFVPDNSARVRYDGIWVLNSVSVGSTTHSTTTPGSTVSLTFFGSGIIVFGTVPASNGSFRPPTASYTIDNMPPLTTTLARASSSIPNQQLFATEGLSSAQHEIKINITDAEDVAYILSKFFVLPLPLNATVTPRPLAGGNETMIANPHDSSENTIRALSALLGTLMFLIIVIGVACVILLRKVRYRRKIAEMLGVIQSDTTSNYLTSPGSIVGADNANGMNGGWSRSSRFTFTSRSQSTRSGHSHLLEKEVAPALPPKAVLNTKEPVASSI